MPDENNQEMVCSNCGNDERFYRFNNPHGGVDIVCADCGKHIED